MKFLRLSSSAADLRDSKFYRALLAEMLGDFILVYVGCGVASELLKADETAVSLTFGFIVAAIAWALGPVSGAHINPAVTLALLVVRKVSLVKALLYIPFQMLGCTVGALVLYGSTWEVPTDPNINSTKLGTTMVNYGLGVTAGSGFFIEAVLTFILVLTIFGVSDPKRVQPTSLFGPLAVGLAVTALVYMGMHFTGASLNPARSFGPALVTGFWKDHWVYWFGPILGGILAAILYESVFAANASLGRFRQMIVTTDYNPDEEVHEFAERRRISEWSMNGDPSTSISNDSTLPRKTYEA